MNDFSQLSATVKMERDRALLRLKLNTPQLASNATQLNELTSSLFATVLELDERSEAEPGVVCTALSAIAHLASELPIFVISADRMRALLSAADSRWLSHPDARVRSALSDALVNLSRRDSVALQSVRILLQDRVLRGASEATVESWRALACALAALKRALTSAEGYVERATVCNDMDLDLLSRVLPPTLTHPNRFVREPGFQLLACVLDRLVALDSAAIASVAESLAVGLQDEWSEVLFGASVAVRSLLVHPSLVAADAAVRDAVLDRVIPAMCMNRHNTVEGVRSWSQQTWRASLAAGQTEAMKRLPAIVEHLELMSRSNNDAMRDSAGACVGEAVRPLVAPPEEQRAGIVDSNAAPTLMPRLAAIVKNLLTDASWWVRSTACLACADLLSVAVSYIDLSTRNELLALLESLTYDNLVSVRERAAEALAAAVAGCGADVVRSRISALLDANLERAFSETVHVHVMVPVPESRARVLQPKNIAHLSEVASHSDNIMLGCCAHVPTNAQESMRPAASWEYSDGCVFLLREFARLWPDDERLGARWLPTLVRLATLTNLRLFVENVWKALPTIAEAVGAERARAAIVPHLWASFVASRQLSPLVKSTAMSAVRSVAELVGIRDAAALEAALSADNQSLVADIAAPWVATAAE